MDTLDRQKGKWVLEQSKPLGSLEAKATQLKLFYFEHIMRRQGSLEKTVMLGKREGIRKRGRPTSRWIESIKEAVGMSLIGAEPGYRRQYIVDNTHS